MSNTPSTRKPYRKAPPQHRENRSEPPFFRNELDGTAVPTEQSQVTENTHVPVLQHGRFSYSDIFGETDLEGLQSVGNSEAHFSSLWSQDSSSEREDASSRDSLGFCNEKLRRQSDDGDLRTTEQNFSQFSRKSAMALENLNDNETLRHSPKTSSQGHSTAFKKPAEILTLKETDSSQNQQPRKGILKPTNLLGIKVESLRKARSVETLAQNRTGQLNYSSQEMSSGQRGRRASIQGKLSSPFSLVQGRHQRPGAEIIEEKLKFSKFLDEITFRVLSPHNLQSLGVTQFKNPSMILYSSGPYQKVGPEPRDVKGEVQDVNIDGIVKGSGGSRDVSERKNGMQIGVESKQGCQYVGRPTSPGTIGKQWVAKKDRIKKHHSPPFRRGSIERCPERAARLLESSGEREQRSNRLGKGNKEDGFAIRQECMQRHDLAAGEGEKDIEKSQGDLSPPLRSDQDRHLATLQMASINVQNKVRAKKCD